MSYLSQPHFHDEEAAFEYVEAHVWPDGRVCPHCGVVDKSGALKGKSTRIGTYKCYACRKPFTVKVGTIFQSSHVKLHIWLQAIFLVASSKKGISSHQLHRTLGVTLKTAWFMSHRIREAMKDGSPLPMGGGGKIVEADETYLGGKRHGKNRKGRQYGIADKMKIVGLVERDGKARMFKVDRVNSKTIREILVTNVDRKSDLRTDEANHYRRVGEEYASHKRVHHALDEYVRGDAHTNTIEGFFSIFKRGMKGVYQHCSEQHLSRYLAEFDFRYNNRAALEVDDAARADAILKGIVGKRLTYQTAN